MKKLNNFNTLNKFNTLYFFFIFIILLVFSFAFLCVFFLLCCCWGCVFCNFFCWFLLLLWVGVLVVPCVLCFWRWFEF